MFKYKDDIGARGYDLLHLHPTCISGARNVLRHHIPELLIKVAECLIESKPVVYIPFSTISNVTWLIRIVIIIELSIAIFATITSDSDKSIKWKLGFRGRPVIIRCMLSQYSS